MQLTTTGFGIPILAGNICNGLYAALAMFMGYLANIIPTQRQRKQTHPTVPKSTP